MKQNMSSKNYQTIESQGGLKPHMTRIGKDYDSFVADVTHELELCEQRGKPKKVNKAKLADLYGVTRNTIYHWLEWLKREKPTLFA